jgi:hypothetical protein
VRPDVWQPWQPGIGDRVRVRLSGECRWDRDGAATATDNPGHDRVLDGQLGTAVEYDPNIWHSDHDYFVALDTSPFDDVGEWLTAAELEPVGETH